jgi:hypothetical protein
VTRQRDIEGALFGSPLGAVDMIVGIVIMAAAPFRIGYLLFKKWRR